MSKRTVQSWLFRAFCVVFGVASVAACGSASSSTGFPESDNASDVGARAGAGGAAVVVGTIGASTEGAGGMPSGPHGSSKSTMAGGVPPADPNTCEGAAALKSYVGCDFWPTVTPNVVFQAFDFAIVVANAGAAAADVTVTRGSQAIATANVPPNELRTIYLPWVPELVGGNDSLCQFEMGTFFQSPVRAVGGAYHVVTTAPVTVYQFSPLEYSATGGPPGKNWASYSDPAGCYVSGTAYSYTNDASLLLPSTAMTGNYRLAAMHTSPVGGAINVAAFFAITATQPDTHVAIKLSPTTSFVVNEGMVASQNGQIVSFTLGQGDVMLVNGTPTTGSDISGSLVQADKPIQIITGMPCITLPAAAAACDHLEESLFPIETLGKHYFVTVPTGPNGQPVGHMVRLIGNVDNTTLTFAGGAPPGTPTTINAGQAIDLVGAQGDSIIRGDFEISADHEFIVETFMLGATIVDPGNDMGKGDPSQSVAVAVEQYRVKYVFLAPQDYEVSYVDVVQPLDAKLTLDGVPVTTAPVAIYGNTTHGVARVTLGPGNGGAHVLEADKPVGIQVMGYGAFTSYQYPGGSNLDAIAPAPPGIK